MHLELGNIGKQVVNTAVITFCINFRILVNRLDVLLLGNLRIMMYAVRCWSCVTRSWYSLIVYVSDGRPWKTHASSTANGSRRPNGRATATSTVYSLINAHGGLHFKMGLFI